MDTQTSNRLVFLQRAVAAAFEQARVKAARGDGRNTTKFGSIEHEGDWKKQSAALDVWETRARKQRERGRDIMESLGFLRSGNGHFADVFTHPLVPGYVLKISWKDGDMGRAWAKWCIGMRDSGQFPQFDKHLPTYYYPLLVSNVWMAWMPYYSNLYETGIDGAADIHDAVYKGAHGYDLFDAFPYADTDDDGMPLVGDELLTLHALGAMIHDEWYNYAKIDLHEANVMFDDEGTLIVTDPLSFSEDEE